MGDLQQIGIAVAIVGGLSSMVWLAGLIVALRGSKPSERAEILRAYGVSRRPGVTARESNASADHDERIDPDGAGLPDGREG